MFGKGIKLFRLLGFEVKIDASWIILALLVTWTLATGYFPFEQPGLASSTYWWMAVVGAVCLFASIIAHEFAHSLVARRDGVPMKGITLFIFGGVAEMDREPPSAGAEFRMAIAGPVASIAIGAAFYLAYRVGSSLGWPIPATSVLEYLGFINVVLAVFNLLPAFPLDGGRVMRSILWQRRGDLRSATRTAANVGSAFGLGFILLGVFAVLGGAFIGGMWWFLIGMFLRGASRMSYQQVELRRALEGEPVSRFMEENPSAVSPSISLQELIDEHVYRSRHRLYPVVRGDELLGCVDVDDIKNEPKERWEHTTVGEVMHRCSGENTVAPEMDAVEALSLMKRSRKSRLVVAQEGELVGVITLRNLLDFLALKLDLESGSDSQAVQRRIDELQAPHPSSQPTG
jgi:Zn-dependent protease/predicted transcriptional regulator